MKQKNKIFQIITLPLYAIAITLFGGCEPDETQTIVNFTNLVWSDEFNTAGAPDPANWTFDIGNGVAEGIPGWGNNELQYYTDRSDNAIVEDGMLKIIAKQESFQGTSYTSARLLTRGLHTFTYGRFEARMKLPWGQGMWPAFWMLGTNSDTWPQRGEIDIMENRGDEPTIIHGTIHGPGYSAGNSIGKEYDFVTERVDDQFHVYGVEWGPNYINFYVDDVLYQQLTPTDLEGDEWVFNDNPFYLILNVAVGGTFAGGPPNADTVFPQTLYVDYVRVYSAN